MFGSLSEDRRVRRCLRREARAFSPYWRARLDAEGLAGLRPVRLADVADPAALVLRPDARTLRKDGPVRLRWRTRFRRLLGQQAKLNDAVVVPRYKPVHWVLADGFPVGYTAADLEVLGLVGRDWFRAAGITGADVLVSVLPGGPSLAATHLAAAARASSVPALALGPESPAEEVARFRPTVLAGRPMDLLRLLSSGRLPEVRLALAMGVLLDDGLRARIESAMSTGASGVCLAAWAPPGVRSLWWECEGAEANGLHTAAGAELVELVDPESGVPVVEGAPGEVVWTGVGWRGTVFLRLRTGVYATVERERCPTCRAVTARLSLAGATPRFFAVLDRHPDVAAWQAELRTVGGMEELLVFITTLRGDRLDAMLRELDGELSATQYVVLDPATLDGRLRAYADARVVDLRAR